MKKELIAQKDPKSPISEIFRTLRTNIQFMNGGKKLQTLQITSTMPGEGKSYVSSNLAVTFAQAGKKVILIDADMRKGRLYTIFEVAPRPGLSNYLSGIDADENGNLDISKYIQATEVPNLLLIPAGNIPPNPSELLVSEQMTNLLEDLKEVCDLIIIDGTPCALVADSVILSRAVDTTVIVTACKETKKDNLDKVVKNIQNVGGKIAGIVLNKIPVSPKKYSQTYYYGSTTMKNAQKNTRGKKAIEYMNNAQNLKTRTASSLNSERRNARPEATKRPPERKEGKQLEKPSFVQKNEHSRPRTNNNNSDYNKTIDVTNDILGQMNSYLEQEKKNLN